VQHALSSPRRGAQGKPALDVLKELVTMDEAAEAAMAQALRGEKDASVAVVGQSAANSEVSATPAPALVV
jgi:hypothetical protein